MGLLTQFNDSYNSAKVEERAGVPDGKYNARIDRVEVKQTKTGKPMVAWQLVIMGGPHDGRRVFKNSVVQDNTVQYLKQDLSVCGFTGDLDSLDTTTGAAQLLDRVVAITVKTNGENSNTYINRLVSATAAAASADDEPRF